MFDTNEFPKISPKNRFKITAMYSLVVIASSYLLLFIFVIVYGYQETLQMMNITSEFTAYQVMITIYTLIPAIVALLFMYKFKTAHWKEPGLNPPKNIFWIGFGIIYTIIVLVPTLLVSEMLKLLDFNPNYYPLSSLGMTFNNIILDLIVYLAVVPVLLLFSPGGFIRIIGEEYGWRGYLTPELLKSRDYIGLIAGLLMVGLIWSLYHIPFFTILSPLPLSLSDMLLSLLGSFGVFFGASFTMAWAYLKTHNLWPALSLHFFWNILNPQITGNIYSNQSGLFLGNLVLINGEGLIGGFFHFVVGIIFLGLILKDKDQLLSDYDQYLNYVEETLYLGYYPAKHSTPRKIKKKKRSHDPKDLIYR